MTQPSGNVAFNTNGLLPAGLHEMTIDQARQLLGFTTRRQNYFARLDQYLNQSSLYAICSEFWIDGSFAESKDLPNDIDLVMLVDLAHLNATSRTEMLNLRNQQYRAHIKQAYKVDPYYCIEGDVNQRNYWLNMFGTTRGSAAKGIVRILK